MYGHRTLNNKVRAYQWLSVAWFKGYTPLYTTSTAQLDIAILEMESLVQYCCAVINLSTISYRAIICPYLMRTQFLFHDNFFISGSMRSTHTEGCFQQYYNFFKFCTAVQSLFSQRGLCWLIALFKRMLTRCYQYYTIDLLLTATLVGCQCVRNHSFLLDSIFVLTINLLRKVI